MFTDLNHYTTALDHAEAAAGYHRMQHDPRNPRVANSYAQLAYDVQQQWAWIVERVDVEFFEGAPRYASSAEMLADLDRGHLFTYLTGVDSDLPNDHPMGALVEIGADSNVTGLHTVLLNDIFRAVHDVMGHGTSRGSFGVVGEMNAWLAHRIMFGTIAHPALWCETRGQSAWTNAWDDHASLPLPKRPYAEQKAGWPDHWLV